MAFWKNLTEGTDTPTNATNLSRSERYLEAVAGANGDFYVDIDGADGLDTGDILRIAFPAATNGASNARLSINGASGTFRNVAVNGTNILARNVEDCDYEIYYDGTKWRFKKGTAIEIFNSAKTNLNLGFPGGLVLNSGVNLGFSIENMRVSAVVSIFETDFPRVAFSVAMANTLRFDVASPGGAPATLTYNKFLCQLTTVDYQSYIYAGNTRLVISQISTTQTNQEADRSVILKMSVVAE